MPDLIRNVNVNLQNGLTELGPFNVQNAMSSITIEIKRCTGATPTLWPDAATTLKFEAWVSQDNGATWRSLGVFQSTGGIAQAKGGGELSVTRMVLQLPSGPGKKVKAEATVTNGPLVSQATITVQ